MRPGQVFITPIVQESWFNALAENNLGRTRPRGWPKAGPGRAEEVSRVGAAVAARSAVTLERSSDGAASAAAGRAGVRLGGPSLNGRDQYRTEERLVLTSMVKPRCCLIQFNGNGTYI